MTPACSTMDTVLLNREYTLLTIEVKNLTHVVRLVC